MVKLSIYVDVETAELLRQCAEDWDTHVSLVVRVLLEDFVTHPERQMELLVPHLCVLEDTRTDAQREAGDRAIAAMQALDVEAIARELGG